MAVPCNSFNETESNAPVSSPSTANVFRAVNCGDVDLGHGAKASSTFAEPSHLVLNLKLATCLVVANVPLMAELSDGNFVDEQQLVAGGSLEESLHVLKGSCHFSFFHCEEGGCEIEL